MTQGGVDCGSGVTHYTELLLISTKLYFKYCLEIAVFRYKWIIVGRSEKLCTQSRCTKN